MKTVAYIILFTMTNVLFSQNLQEIIINNNLKLNEVKDYIKANNVVLEPTECDPIKVNYLNIPTEAYSKSVKEDFTDDEKYVFNIYFHVIYNSDHTRPINITENSILYVVSSLNITFNQFNIFFKYKGYGDIDNSDYMNIYRNDDLDESHNTMPELRAYCIENDIYEANAINMFITDEILHEDGGLLNGIAFMPGTMSVIADEMFFDTTVLHETAHNLNLLHLSKDYDNDSCEHVTRDDTNPNYNANTHGDEVVDTEATFPFTESDLINYDGDLICDFLDIFEDKFDCEGNPYRVVDDSGTVLINIPSSNYMSAYHNICRSQFSNGQGVRMRESIEENPSGVYTNVLTNVESLYEPYNVFYGTYTNKYMYQPGFDYEFVLCHQDGAWGGYNEPSDYNDISFTYNDDGYINYFIDYSHTPYKDIHQRDHTAVKILQIDDTQPRKCYSTLLKSAISGSVIKFNDGVPNSNITVSQKDSLGINNPTLIPDLQNGLYNIKKNYNDGSIEENLILKNDE